MGRGRAPCCDKSQVKRGPWSPAEDLRLTTFIQQHGHENWRSLPKQAGLLRCGKSCRLRWINYLRPDVKRGNFTSKEEETIIQLHESLGNKWSKIAAQLPGRTDNEIKNVWNTHLKKKLAPKKSTITSPTSSSSGSYTSCDNNKNVGMELGEDQTSQDFKPSEVLSLDENLDFETLLSNSSHSYNSEITNFSPVDPSAPDQDELMGPLLDFFTTEMNHEQEIFPSAEAFEIPLETDSDFWNMLDDSAGAFIQSNEAQWREEVDLGHTNQENNLCEAERWKWLRYLENELGLEATRDENKEQETNGAAEPSHDTVLKQEIDQVMDYFQIRSSSPQNIEM